MLFLDDVATVDSNDERTVNVKDEDMRKRETFLEAITPLEQLFKPDRVNWIKEACKQEALRQGNWSLVSSPSKLRTLDFIPGFVSFIKDSESRRQKITKTLLDCPDYVVNCIDWQTIWDLRELLRLKSPDGKPHLTR